MGRLDGFSPFDFSEGVPYASVTRNGLTFNKSVTMKLKYPRYVQLLIGADEKQIALKSCDEFSEKAVSFFAESKEDAKVLSVRWNGKDLLNTLSGMMGWDLSKSSFRVDGELLAEEEAMLFDLTKAREMI